LRAIAEQARRVFWLNPEPEAEWGATDSAMDDYRSYCRGAFEVRSLRQLGDVIASLVLVRAALFARHCVPSVLVGESATQIAVLPHSSRWS
jgi:hypothetical protein